MGNTKNILSAHNDFIALDVYNVESLSIGNVCISEAWRCLIPFCNVIYIVFQAHICAVGVSEQIVQGSDNKRVRCWGIGALGRLGYENRDNIGIENGSMANCVDIDLGVDFIADSVAGTHELETKICKIIESVTCTQLEESIRVPCLLTARLNAGA